MRCIILSMNAACFWQGVLPQVFVVTSLYLHAENYADGVTEVEGEEEV